jgi:hypothetical protein
VQAHDRILRKSVCDPTKCECRELKWFEDPGTLGRWGNGVEEAPHPTDSENLLLSEIMKGDSNRGRVELKDSTMHVHLDVNGMDIDVEPEDLGTNVDLHEVIGGGTPRPMVPIMTMMGILLRVEVTLKEADTLGYARRG